MLLLQYGGHLATVNDLATNQFITATLNGLWWQNSGVWIGLNDRIHEQQWQWDNGQLTSGALLNGINKKSELIH